MKMFRFIGLLLGFALIFTLAVPPPALAGILFKHRFAPQQGLVLRTEQPYRSEICLNGLWRFQPVSLPTGFQAGHGAPALPPPTPDGWSPTPIRIPSPWNVNSFSQGDGGDFRCFPSYPASWDHAAMGWLQRDFRIPPGWRGRRIILHFEAVAGSCEVLVNGKEVIHHFDIFLPFQADITRYIHWHRNNELLVGVRRADLFDISGRYGGYTFPTGSFWGIHIVGIWQDVFLEGLPPIRVSRVQIEPQVDQNRLVVRLRVRNDTTSPATVSLSGSARRWISLAGKSVIAAPDPRWRLASRKALRFSSRKLTVAPNQQSVIEISEPVNRRLALWSPSAPNLYGLILQLKRNNRIIDRKYVRFGWRQFTIQGRHLRLNGKPIQLLGDAWHFMGVPEMTRRYAWAWFRMLKEAHGDAVRLHAEPYPRFFLDMADEMGICVLDESGIWASHCSFNYNAPDIWRRFHRDVVGLVRRDRNHPCVFGWSVANEINPALGVDNAPADMVNRVDDRIADLADQIKKLDPTRSWVSSDGDQDMNGRLPIISNHYGDPSTFKQLAQHKRPWAEGEAGSAYYATPAQAAHWAGDVAYRNVKGRMDGIAIEDYGLIKAERAYGAAYGCIFNTVWYGLQPLALGLPNTKKPPTLKDGILFGKFVSGVPGMQPERLGTYCTTLNPGYDPSLPLFKPWPLFKAVQAAYAPTGPLPCKWDHKWVTVRPNPPHYSDPVRHVGFLGDPGGALFYCLQSAGVPLQIERGTGVPVRMLVVEGKMLSQATLAEVKSAFQATIAHGGKVLIWGFDQSNLAALNALLPAPVQLTGRQAISLVTVGNNPVTTSIPLGDLYFGGDASAGLILSNGMGGPILKRGQILLTACKADWRRWNDRPENIKTASVLRSERESKPSGAALLNVKRGKGAILLCSIQTHLFTSRRLHLLRELMGNLGVALLPQKPGESGIPGLVYRALAIGGFPAPSFEAALDTDYLSGEANVNPAPDEKVGNLQWHSIQVTSDNLFDLLPMQPAGTYCAAYLSFWVYCPFALDQLLASPNPPEINLLAGSDDGDQIWLNGKLIFQDRGVHPLTPDSQRCDHLPLKKGWNHFLVKVDQAGGLWQFQARLQSNDLRVLRGLRITETKGGDDTHKK